MKNAWIDVGSLGPFNEYDYPLWVLMPDGKEVFLRHKIYAASECPNYGSAVKWRSARGESGEYRVRQHGGCFYPQESICGEWMYFHTFKPFSSLADAKAEISREIAMRSNAPEIFHHYP